MFFWIFLPIYDYEDDTMKKTIILLSLAAGLSNMAFAQDVKPALADADCLAAFNISSAKGTCDISKAKVVGDASCNIQASCEFQYTGGGAGFHPNNVTIPYSSVPSLSNCTGILRVGGC